MNQGIGSSAFRDETNVTGGRLDRYTTQARNNGKIFGGFKVDSKVVNEKEVMDVIKALKKKKSFGVDGISSEILKIGAPIQTTD